jgi:hypothetical protein
MTISKRLLPLAAIAFSVMVAAFVASGALTRSADVAEAHTATGTAHFELDTNTANGICGASVDAANTVFAGSTFQVAICLSDGADAPINGNIATLTLGLDYDDTIVRAPNVAGDGLTNLDANPDMQDSAWANGQAAWDCVGVNNSPPAMPRGNDGGQPGALTVPGVGIGPAVMTCLSVASADEPLASGVTDVVALVDFDAHTSGGPTPLDIFGSFLTGVDEPECGVSIDCIGGEITVLDAADIEVEKECNPDPAFGGDQLICTVTVTNNGPEDAPNVILFDDMTDAPAALYNDVATDAANGGTNFCGLVVFPPAILAPMNVVACGSIGIDPGAVPFGLLNGESAAFDIVFDIADESAGKQLQNGALAVAAGFGLPIVSNPADPNLDPLVAIVASQPPCNADPDPITCAGLAILLSPIQLCGTAVFGPVSLACNNEDRVTVNVASADVTIAKALNPPVAQAVEGDSLTYDVTVSVGAGSAASGVVITDTVDAEQTITAATVGGGYTCAENPATNVAGIAGQTATCTLEQNVPASSNVVMTVTADVVGSADGNCQNDADVTWADPMSVADQTSIPCFPPSVRMQKDATLDEDLIITSAANLWLCLDPNPAGPGPANPSCEYYDAGLGEIVNNGAGHLVVFERLFNQLDQDGAGAFEFQLKFDHKIFDIEIFHGVDLNGDGDCTDNGENQAEDLVDACYLYQTGRIPNAPDGVGGCDMSIINENFILFGCVSKDPDGAEPITPGPIGASDVVATIHISPEPDLVHRLTPGQKNGVLRTILDENCEVADVFGDPLGSGQYDEFNREIPLIGIVTGGLVEICDDLTVTTRILEGDLNLDCVVDLEDDQQIAFRYGAFFGNLLYDPWFDLEPSLKDFDVDIKDLQKVFGRNGSTCADPIPDQDAQEGGGFDGSPDPGPLP